MLAILGVVILVVGQLFNLVLALFEPGIQGARLIYVEFFSKFYHGQGRPFTPFKGRRTHTLSQMEMAAVEAASADAPADNAEPARAKGGRPGGQIRKEEFARLTWRRLLPSSLSLG